MELFKSRAGKYLALVALTAGCSFPAFAAKGPDCSAATLQKQLDAGQTPFNIYKTCGSTTPLIGLQYQGGLITYLNTQDGSGFVVTSSYPQFNTQGWRVQPQAFWHNMVGGGYQITGATDGSIGGGAGNTAKILQTLGVPGSQPYWPYSYAAYGSTQKISGYSDWVLPSSGEMSLVVKNIITYNGCLNTIRQGIGSGTFWTSTEVNFNYAIMTDCNGNNVQSLKNNNAPLRLIRYFKNVPAASVGISDFSPTSQTIGQSITINGTGFGTTPADNLVSFAGGSSATATTATATQLTVLVPPKTITGPLTVTSPLGKSPSSSTPLTIIPLAISSFSPTTQSVGQTITIVGTGFSTTAADNIVNFAGNVSAAASAATATQLTVTVPTGATSGPISVTSHLENSAASSKPLQIPSPQSALLNFSTLVPGGSANAYSLGNFTVAGISNGKTCASMALKGCIYAGEISNRGGQPPAKAAYLAYASLTFKLDQGGSPFSLASAQLANLNSTVAAQSITFTGYLAAGGTVSYTAAIPPNSIQLQTITFPATFKGLSSVQWNPELTVITNIKVGQ